MGTDLTIREYSNADQAAAAALFRRIYPLDPKMAERMAYDVALPGHVTTKLAFLGSELVGQANVFLYRAIPGSANLGYHVDPDHRRRGIASQLSLLAISTAFARGTRRILVRMEPQNVASIGVARRLGLEPMGAPPNAPAGLVWFEKRLAIDRAETGGQDETERNRAERQSTSPESL